MHHITARPTEPGTGALASEASAVTVWSKILVVGQNICSHHHIYYQRGMKSQGESGVSRHSPRLAFTSVDLLEAHPPDMSRLAVPREVSVHPMLSHFPWPGTFGHAERSALMQQYSSRERALPLVRRDWPVARSSKVRSPSSLSMSSASLSPDERILTSTSNDSSVDLWDAADGVLRRDA
jgi:hypothetical protein